MRYHDISAIFVIFELRLHLIEFKNKSPTSRWPCFVNKMFEILGEFLDTASQYIQKHEYHFFEWLNFIILCTCSSNLLFTKKNSSKWNKLTKYSKKHKKMYQI